jgi:hypothetical protein
MKKSKLLFLCTMVVLLVFALASPPRVQASCTGDQCGCSVDEAVCMADCPPPGNPNRQVCIHSCIQEAVRCAICCCCSCPDGCPINGGCC